MVKFEVTEAKIWHCGSIVRRLRDEHFHALSGLGINSHQEIRDKFDASMFVRALFIDDHLVGLGGVTGTAISTDGFIWLALTEEASQYPVAIAREAKRQIDEIMKIKRTLYTSLIPSDKTALRFALRLGFELEHTTPVPAGQGYVLSVVFHKLAA